MSIVSTVFNFLFSCSDGKPGMLSKSGYHISDDKVYYFGGLSSGPAIELIGADPKSFKNLDEQGFPEGSYGKDKQHVYFEGKLISNANASSLVRLKGYFSRDQDHVFYLNQILSDDPDHFEFIDDNVHKDCKHVYWSDKIISDDPASFKLIGQSGGSSYYKDQLGILANDTRIPGADAESFKPLAHGYSMDKSKVYLMESTQLQEVPNAEPSSFKVLNAFYTSDSQHVFWRGKPLPDSDPSTFEILNEESHCSRDKKQAYHWDIVIPNTDPTTFPNGKRCKYCTNEKIVFED
ncbi:MAG: DKNYY domain-containing protein [Dyadobacter sp.]|uniref:DKNYY domain-containing protein n=1 Tax=Dyadobacter sp. TaxID=1914288 RepID=UPI0032647FE2